MPWYFPWSESIKKRACRYLLQHYLGDFLKEKLDLDQLTVDLYNGKGTVTEVPLDVWALNEMLSSSGVPVELVDGFIESISVSVPWKALLNDSCEIEIHGLQLVFASRQKSEESMAGSVNSWNSMSMTTSIQMAQECLRQDPTLSGDSQDTGQSFEGLEAFAQTIESVLARVRLSFVNTKIRLEHIPLASTSGVGIDLTIDRIDYWDLSHEEVGKENTPQHSVYEPVAVAIKNFQMIGIHLFIEEFPKHKRTRLRDIYSDEDLSSIPLTSVSEGFSKLQRTVSDDSDEDGTSDLVQKVKFLSSCGKQNVKVRLKQNESIPGPKFDMEYSLAALNVFMTPRQLHLLTDVASSLSDAASTQANSSADPKENYYPHHRKMKMREMKTEDFMKVEESLQNQFSSIESQDWKTNLHSLNSTNESPYGSLTKPRSNSDDEFFSMNEFPLPQLGQPTLLNTVRQCNLTVTGGAHRATTASTTIPGCDDFTAGRFSPTSPRSTLSNVSLGGSSGSLNSKGTLTERASTVFRASSSGSPSQRILQPFMTSPSGSAGVGLAGIGKIDDTTDSMKVRLRASNVIMVLLHRDPFLATTAAGVVAADVSSGGRGGYNQQMRGGRDRDYCMEEMSKTFFDQVNQYSIQSLFGMNGEDIRENLLHLCNYDHIRILASALNLEAESTFTSGGNSLNTDIILGKLSLDENLYNELENCQPYSQVQLLHFDHQDVSPLYPGTFGASQSPSIKVNIAKSHRNTFSGVHSRGTVPPKSQITIDLGQLVVDLDLSIVDRIASLLWPGALYKASAHFPDASVHHMYNSLATGRSANHHSDFKQVIFDNPDIVEYKTDFVCRCPQATVLLRVPIPDLRPSGDIEKKPWWRKSVYAEHLKVELSALEFKTFFSALHSTLSSYDIGFKKAKGFFVTTNNQHYHMFDISSTTEEGETGSMGVDQPRILVNLLPPSSRSVLEETENVSKNSSPDSIEDQYPWMKSEPSPFSTQPSMYNENEEMVTPGSIAEMNAFQEFVSTSAKTGVNCYLPSMQINLHSNDVFELFYNRIFGALLMWEPSAPSPIDFASKTTNPYESVHINLASHIGQLDSGNLGGGGGGGGDKFFMCRSTIRGDAFDSRSIDDNSFFSADFTDNTALPKHQQQTNFCFSLHIDQGNVAMFPPAKFLQGTDDGTSEPTLEDLLVGHVVLNIKDGHLFVASGFKGNPNLDFIELYSNSVHLYHSSLLNEALQLNLMEDALCMDYLERTIYPSDPSVWCKGNSAAGDGAMLSLAMKSTSYPDQKRKDNIVSVAVSGKTLDHRVLPPGHSWLTQIMDFMEIKDYPILGYTFPTVMTTLHMHLWGCAVDYRPKNIPIHSLLTMNSLSLSSNIIPGSSTSILRFIIEDSALHISDKTFIDTGDFNDFVTVFDMGTFELSLKFTNGEDPRQPIFDLSMSNNMLNIRTCADSCTALMKLVKYFASDGDLQSEIVNELENETMESDVPVPSQTISEGQSDDSIDIHSLMADAMDDTDESVDARFQGTVIDECFDASSDYDDEDVDEEDSEEQSSADEFCLLDNEQAGAEDMEEFEPIIRKMTDREIVVIEDFIATPQGKHDQLLSPEGYPTATHRYTIKEMSVVWQMYGGSDFGHPSRSSSHSSNDGRRQSSSNASFGPRYDGNNKTNRVNRVKGGPNRDLDTLMELQMNKIRFQHQNFPETAKQIYRDVLLVYDIEIRDRLSTSMINKFLYRFSSENMPKQSSANMIAIRFLVTKPEDSARSEEAALRVSLQPLRLNVDQDSLFFLRDFFSHISGAKSAKTERQRPLSQADFSVPLSSSPGVEPFQTIPVVDSSPTPSPQRAETPIRHSVSSESLKSEKTPPSLFIKSFLFSPEVPIRLDYQGKHLNVEQGTIAGLIMGLSQLNCSELRLKRLCSRSGLLGVDKLLNFIVTEWLNDIKQNQLKGILGGVGPTYSLMQLFQGLKDLFWIPVLQYRQDGRIVRGLQRGAHSFSTSTAMAVLELSNRLVTTMQSLAELTFDMVSSGPSHVSTRSGNAHQTVHPAELREGIANAYAVLTEGLAQTAQNIVRVATEEHEKKGMTGAVGGVLRQIPPTVVKPLILATEATSNVLGGAMNQLAPDKRKEALEKWKSDT